MSTCIAAQRLWRTNVVLSPNIFLFLWSLVRSNDIPVNHLSHSIPFDATLLSSSEPWSIFIPFLVFLFSSAWNMRHLIGAVLNLQLVIMFIQKTAKDKGDGLHWKIVSNWRCILHRNELFFLFLKRCSVCRRIYLI